MLRHGEACDGNGSWGTSRVMEMSLGCPAIQTDMQLVDKKRHPSNNGMAVEGFLGEDIESTLPVRARQRPLRGPGRLPTHPAAHCSPPNMGDT